MSEKESLFKTDKERNDYQADSEFALKYWKNDEYFNEHHVLSSPHKTVKIVLHVFGLCKETDFLANELNRIKNQQTKIG